jgi:hypothetical protein
MVAGHAVPAQGDQGPRSLRMSCGFLRPALRCRTESRGQGGSRPRQDGGNDDVGIQRSGSGRAAPRADRPVRRYSVSVTLPYRDAGRADEGLRAGLRRRVAASGEVADWTTLVVHSPRPSSDARGHVWFEHSATVDCPAGGTAQA